MAAGVVVWAVELRQLAYLRGGRSAKSVLRWATPSRVEAEMVAAAELVRRGVDVDNATLFTSMAGRAPVHADCGDQCGGSSYRLSLRIYSPLRKRRWRRYLVAAAVERHT